MKPTWESDTGDIATWQIGHCACTVVAEHSLKFPITIISSGAPSIGVSYARRLADALVSAADWVEQRKEEV